MKALKFIGLGLVAVIGLFVVIGLFLPSKWQVETSYVTSATPGQLFPLVSDFKQWPEWAAWNSMDAEVKWEYAGAESGVGAKWSWAGPTLGRGAMTITKAEAATGVWFDEAIESDDINAKGSITWSAEGDKVRITWKDEGELPPVFGGYFKEMLEKNLTDHFAKGLEKLAKAAEAAPAPSPKNAPVQAEVAQPSQPVEVVPAAAPSAPIIVE